MDNKNKCTCGCKPCQEGDCKSCTCESCSCNNCNC